MNYQIFVITCCILLVSACGTKEEIQTQSASSIAGEWQLVHVSCSGTESTLLSDAALTSGPISSSITVLGNGEGKRVWKIQGCEATTNLSSVSYPSDSTVRVQDGSTQCNEACGPYPACQSDHATPASDYLYSVADNSLHLTLPADVKARESSPCGTGQSTDNVEFVYKLVTH